MARWAFKWAAFAISLVLLSAPDTGVATAGSLTGQPLTIQTASLVQDGQDLVWRVDLAKPFSPGALSGERRSLCLLLESGPARSVGAEACLAGPGLGKRAPRLLYVPITPTGPGRVTSIQATVTRSSDRELTASFLPASVGLDYRGRMHWQVISTLTAPGCVPAVLGPGRCETLVPVRPAALSLHKPRLVGCVAKGPDWVFHGSTHVRDIALTFDDGPWPDPPTSEFVHLLARLHAPATFFEIGRQIGPYDPGGKVEREMLADGDMIGDHTWTHPDLVGLSPTEQRSQIVQTAAAIQKATGFTPCLFRAPYGAVDSSLLREARKLGFTTIQWNIDPRDWALPGESEIIDNVLDNAQNGGIVEEHFGGGPRYETLDALPAEIAGLRRKGYRLVTLTQMLGYKLVYR